MADKNAPVGEGGLFSVTRSLSTHGAKKSLLGNLTCDLDCRNGGYCTLKSEEYDESELIKAALRGELLESCVCRPGYAGIVCEQAVKECELTVDGRRTCHNGAPCAQSGLDEDGKATFTCDCSVASSASPFAGAMCKRPATEYCGRDGESIANSFCTNGGTCESNLSGKAQTKVPFQHNGCVCAVEFDGDHCEYLKSIYLGSDDDDGRSPGAKFGVFVGVVFLFIVTLYAARGLGRRIRRRKMWETISAFSAADHDLSFEEQIENAPTSQPYTDEEVMEDTSRADELEPVKII